MMPTKPDAIKALVPGAEFAVDGDGVVIWYKPSIAPVTDEQINAKLAEMIADAPKQAVREKRLLAYQTESDPIFFQWQRGEKTEEEWKAKIAEIDARYPYPQ